MFLSYPYVFFVRAFNHKKPRLICQCIKYLVNRLNAVYWRISRILLAGRCRVDCRIHAQRADPLDYDDRVRFDWISVLVSLARLFVVQNKFLFLRAYIVSIELPDLSAISFFNFLASILLPSKNIWPFLVSLLNLYVIIYAMSQRL